MQRKPWLIFMAMLLAALAIYAPSLNGRPIWDDDQHITAVELRSISGLGRIWTDLSATSQYYPLTHTVFWFQWQLWGEHALGYHLVNVLLHACAAFLVWRVVGELLHKAGDTRPLPSPLPGGEGAEQAALLAAGIFLLHPVHVESVAWISELKNTLSAVFYLLAMRAYLRWDQVRQPRGYAAAAGFFLLALLSKSVTATLPGALLVIFWWKRGKLEWKRDVTPTLPLWLLGIGSGLFTVWVEKHFIGAMGEEFSLTLLQRCILAGQVPWFYAGKLFWPEPLIFIYPRWELDVGRWQQWLGVIGLLIVAMMAGVWPGRPFGTAAKRGIAAGAIFFGGTLLPALGFFNVYPFRYSWVADHFQYLASLGVILPAAWSLSRCPVVVRYAVLAVLAAASWNQAAIYQGYERVFQHTIDHNPGCWMAYNNLGVAAKRRGESGVAEAYHRHALELNPDFPEAVFSLSILLEMRGELDEALIHAQKAVTLLPKDADAQNNLGTILARRGQVEPAIAAYRKALELQPHFPVAMTNLASQLSIRGETREAMELLNQAMALDPNDAPTRMLLSQCLSKAGRREEAIGQLQKAVELAPNREDWKAMLEEWRKK